MKQFEKGGVLCKPCAHPIVFVIFFYRRKLFVAPRLMFVYYVFKRKVKVTRDRLLLNLMNPTGLMFYHTFVNVFGK